MIDVQDVTRRLNAAAPLSNKAALLSIGHALDWLAAADAAAPRGPWDQDTDYGNRAGAEAALNFWQNLVTSDASTYGDDTTCTYDKDVREAVINAAILANAAEAGGQTSSQNTATRAVGETLAEEASAAKDAGAELGKDLALGSGAVLSLAALLFLAWLAIKAR